MDLASFRKIQFYPPSTLKWGRLDRSYSKVILEIIMIYSLSFDCLICRQDARLEVAESFMFLRYRKWTHDEKDPQVPSSWLKVLQARDNYGNNKTDSGDRWVVRYSLEGSTIDDIADMLALGAGRYSYAFTLTSIGSGTCSMSVHLQTAEVSLGNFVCIWESI